MKIVIAYLLIGVIIQIIFVSLYILCKSFMDDAIDTTKVLLNKNIPDFKLLLSPKTIAMNVFAWPINICISLYALYSIFIKK